MTRFGILAFPALLGIVWGLWRFAPDMFRPSAAGARSMETPTTQELEVLEYAEPLPDKVESVSEQPLVTLRPIRTAIQLKFNSGDYVGAVEEADRMLQIELVAEDRVWLLEQMPVLLTAAGWAYLKLGNCVEARRFFERAQSMRDSVESTKGLVYCAYKERDLPRAAELARSYLHERPNDVEVNLLYVEVLESEGRFEEAVATLERIEQLPGEPTGLDQRLASMRAKAREGRHQLYEAGEHFSIRYHAGEHESVVPVAFQVLETAYDELLFQFGFQSLKSRVEVILYPSRSFQDAVQQGPEWASGVFDGRIRLPLPPHPQDIANSGLRSVLRHELVHALLANQSDRRRLPTWFEEGLAQRLQCEPRCSTEFPFPSKLGNFMTREHFEQSFAGLNSASANLAYRQSLFLILVLERTQDGQDPLGRIIRGITAQSSTDSDGILEPVGLTFDQLIDRAAKVWSKGRLPVSYMR